MHIKTDNVMGFIITLILVGLILIFAEILLVPGVGIAGILGLLSLGGSCFYAFTQIGTTAGTIVTAVNVVETKFAEIFLTLLGMLYDVKPSSATGAK